MVVNILPSQMLLLWDVLTLGRGEVVWGMLRGSRICCSKASLWYFCGPELVRSHGPDGTFGGVVEPKQGTYFQNQSGGERLCLLEERSAVETSPTWVGSWRMDRTPYVGKIPDQQWVSNASAGNWISYSLLP